LCHRDSQAHETGRFGRCVLDFLIGGGIDRSIALDELPGNSRSSATRRRDRSRGSALKRRRWLTETVLAAGETTTLISGPA